MQDDKLLARGEEIARAEMADKDKYQWQWGDWAELVATSRGKGRPRSDTVEDSLEYFREKLVSKALEVPTLDLLERYRAVAKAWPLEARKSPHGGISWTVFRELAYQDDRFELISEDLTIAKARQLVSARKAESTGGTVVGEVVVLDHSILPEAEPETQEEVPAPAGFIDPESLKTPAAAENFVKSLPPDVGIALSKAIAADPTTRRNVIKNLVQRDTENRQKANDSIRTTAPELAEDVDWLALTRQMTIIMTAFSKAIELSKVVNITTERRNRLRLMQERIEAASDFLGSWREGGSSSIDDELKALLDNPSSF